MSDNLIFVSCGQQTPEEKDLGTAVKNLIDSTPGFKAYFAEHEQSLDSDVLNIFKNLWECSGFIALLHKRNRMAETEECYPSVWVNQEIAIIAYRQHFEAREIPILVYKDDEVRVEGSMASLIVNPLTLKSKPDVLERTGKWLSDPGSPWATSGNYAIFLSKWIKLPPYSTKVIAALLDEGGNNVNESVIRIRLQESYGFSKHDASQAVTDSRILFNNTGLVQLITNIHTGDEMTINPYWKWRIARRIKEELQTS